MLLFPAPLFHRRYLTSTCVHSTLHIQAAIVASAAIPVLKLVELGGNFLWRDFLYTS